MLYFFRGLVLFLIVTFIVLFIIKLIKVRSLSKVLKEFSEELMKGSGSNDKKD